MFEKIRTGSLAGLFTAAFMVILGCFWCLAQVGRLLAGLGYVWLWCLAKVVDRNNAQPANPDEHQNPSTH